MIRTGELTGKLDLCCFHLARQQQEQLQLSEKVKKALRYPLIVLLLALLVVMGMLTLSCRSLPLFTSVQHAAPSADQSGDKRRRRPEQPLATAAANGDITVSPQPAGPSSPLVATPATKAASRFAR
ncbi:type IV pilin biogenesis protein [Raoultella terrigena]|uniref:Type IV pilin biogenesis protein n=1 Tax=Raoultella terrigena TaxID=577 RepID=A0A4U9D6B2_RAOTE|nr:type IV pilin biogenesis protein [Raoultella terrigena]